MRRSAGSTTFLLACTAVLATRAAAAQERDAGAPAEPTTPSPDAGATPAPPNDEPLPMLAGGVVGHTPEGARPAEERAFGGQRRIGISLGGAHGYGLGLRLRASRFAIDLSGGFRPVFATYSVRSDEAPEFRLLGGFEFAVTPTVIVYRAGPRTELGLSGAYAYNTLLGHGVTVSFYIDYDLGEHLAAHFFLGPTIFPKAESRIRAEADFPAGGSVSSGIAAFQGIAGANLCFFP
jgi:hypothetical protein